MGRVLRRNIKTNIKTSKSTISSVSLESRGKDLSVDTKFDHPIDPDITFIQVLDTKTSDLVGAINRHVFEDITYPPTAFDYEFDFPMQ